MRNKSPEKTIEISDALDGFHSDHAAIEGLGDAARKTVLVRQLIDSIRRVEYLNAISARSESANLYSPYSGSFQPLAGAVALHKQGNVDDAYWLVFLATHFGKHGVDRWNLTEDFYGRFGTGGLWDWATASADRQAVADWLEAVHPDVTAYGRSRRFGNHRKYETFKPGPKGTGHAVATYIDWIGTYGSHQSLIEDVQKRVGQNPKDVFACLYLEMDRVARFGRLGKFDFLCNLSNLMIAPIVPDTAHVAEASGPKAGARLLFGAAPSVAQLDFACAKLADHLNVSPQVIEDALCNWQKSPDQYQLFRG